jgi:hypothetical protein
MVTAKKFSLFELVTPSREARYAPTLLDLSGTLLQNSIRCELFLERIKALSGLRQQSFFLKTIFCSLVPWFFVLATVQLCRGQNRHGVKCSGSHMNFFSLTKFVGEVSTICMLKLHLILMESATA